MYIFCNIDECVFFEYFRGYLFWLALWAVLFARVYFGNISACITHNLATPLEFAVALGDYLKQGIGMHKFEFKFLYKFYIDEIGTFQGYPIELVPN
jgi:hypothetical protein